MQVAEQHHAAHPDHGSIHLVGEGLPKFGVERLTRPGPETNSCAEVASKAIGVVTRVEQRTADLKAANQKLQDMLKERKRLENELLDIAEQERQRIGFDLHDDLGQKLAGMSLMIKGLEQRLAHDKHPAASEAGKIRALIDEAIHHTHNLAHQFSSFDINGDDLSGMLKELAANVEKMFSICCVFTLKGDVPALRGEVMFQLYKIAQEATSNAIKHGTATRVAISVSRSPDKLVLTVKNDGVPFSTPSDPKKRMGLRIMNYRASTIGALFEIRADHKGGTLVTCTVPMKNGGLTQPGFDHEELVGGNVGRLNPESRQHAP